MLRFAPLFFPLALAFFLLLLQLAPFLLQLARTFFLLHLFLLFLMFLT
jgi:hypothetical protein